MTDMEFNMMVRLGGVSGVKDVEKKIKDMDKDKNRLLTYQELIKIFREIYGDQCKSLLKVFNVYASVQNHNLINY